MTINEHKVINCIRVIT